MHGITRSLPLVDVVATLPITLPRLVLRRPRARDAEAIFEAMQESRAELDRYMPWSPSTRAPSDTLAWIRRVPRDARRAVAMDFGVFDSATKKYLGSMGFARLDIFRGVGEIGYWLRRGARGRGVTTRVAIELVHVGFVRFGLSRIEVRMAEGNRASALVPERLGFTYEGTLRAAQPDHRVAGRRIDTRVYSLLPREWRTLRNDWDRRFVRPFDRDSRPVWEPPRAVRTP